MPTSKDEAGYTPLHAAASYNKQDVMYVLRVMYELTAGGISCIPEKNQKIPSTWKTMMVKRPYFSVKQWI